MTPDPPDDELGGLARSIDRLFSSVEDEAPAPPPDAPPTQPEEGDERTSEGSSVRAEIADADPFTEIEMVGAPEAGAGVEAEPGKAPETAPESGARVEAEAETTPEPGARVEADPEMTPEPEARVEAEPDPETAPASVPNDPAEEAFAEFERPGRGWAPEGVTPTQPPVEPSDPGDALEMAVERYLAGDGVRRDELGRRIRELADELGTGNRPEPLADAVERLVIAGHREGGQQAPLALARQLVTPGVATSLTRRLGTTRDEERRSQLVEVFSELGHETATAVADALSTTDDRAARRAFMRALVGMTDAALGVVSDMVEDSRWFVVRNAVLILGEMGGESSVQYLTTTLAHDDPRVRRETVLALAKIGGEDAGALVRNVVSDPDPGVRAAAAMAVGELGGERDVRLLVAALDEESDTDVEVALLRALGHLGDPGAVPAVEKRAVGGFFSRSAPEVRVAAYRALAAIGTPRARQLLDAAVDDRDPAVQRVARDATAD